MITVTCAVGVGADAVLFSVTLGAQLRRLAHTVGPHALEDLVQVLLGQVGALDAHVDDLDTVIRLASLLTCSAICFIRISRLSLHYLLQRRAAQHAADFRFDLRRDDARCTRSSVRTF